MLRQEFGALASTRRTTLAPVMAKVAPAETGRLHFECDLVVARDRITEAHELKLAMPSEYHATHRRFLRSVHQRCIGIAASAQCARGGNEVYRRFFFARGKLR